MLARGPPISDMRPSCQSKGLPRGPSISARGLLYTPEVNVCHRGPPYIDRGFPVLVKRGLLCWPEGLLYQAKGFRYWPGPPISTTGHPVSGRGPPIYTRRYRKTSKDLADHLSARSSLYLPGASCVGQKGPSVLTRGAPISRKGRPVLTRGPRVSARGLYYVKCLLYRPRGPPTGRE